MRRFELSEGTSNKFWEVEVDGTTVTTRWGRIGTSGQSKTKDFPTAAKAQAEHDSLVREKTGKGYQEVAAGGASLPKAPAAAGPAPAPAPAPSPAPATAPAEAEASAPPAAPAGQPSSDGPEIRWAPGQRTRAYPRRASGVPRQRLDRAASFEAVRSLYQLRRSEVAALRDAGSPDDRTLLDEALAYLEGPVPERPVSVAVDGLVGALVCQGKYQWRPRIADLINLWAATGGLGHAVEALVEWMSWAMPLDANQLVLARMQVPPGDLHRLFDGWVRLRHILAGADQTDWLAARDVAARLRKTGNAVDRSAMSFLFPDEPGWASDDVRDAIRSSISRATGALLASLRDGALMVKLIKARSLWQLLPRIDCYNENLPALALAMVEGAGPDALPALVLLYEKVHEAVHKRVLADAMAMIRTPASLAAIVERIDQKEMQAAASEAMLGSPTLGLPLLAAEVARSRKAQAEALLTMIVRQNGALVPGLLPALPEPARRVVVAAQGKVTGPTEEAPAERLPPLLAAPPWTRPRKRQAATVLELAPIEQPDVMAWPSPQAKESWLSGHVPRFSYVPEHQRPMATLHPFGLMAEAEELLSLPPARVRERLAELPVTRPELMGRASVSAALLVNLPEPLALALWEMVPAHAWYFSSYAPAEPWLARTELKALPGLVRIAETALAMTVEIFMPFRSMKLAPLAAEAYLRLKKAKQPAQAWLLAHAEYASLALIPVAVGRPGKPREAAVAALRLLADARPAVLEAAAARYQVGPVLNAVLEAGTSDDYPARMPKMPAFFQPAALPRPTLSDGTAALPLTAVEHLGSMLAISTLDAPYGGLVQVKEACDRGSLARFAWDLFGAWRMAGSPSKENWAFTALAHLGDDECARKLAALVREWPGEGGHGRAVTGLDILATIGSDVALMHLNGIAQKLKFKGLQERAREKIAALAEQRGFTAEELADRLVPDLGLDEDGSLTLDFGPRAFRVGFDEHLRPFVRDTEGKHLAELPKPGKSDDAEKSASAVERWRGLKKDVKTLASQQILRLELAMGSRRRFAPDVFRRFIVEHPLVQHIARRLVWGVYDGTGALAGSFRVSEDGSYADAGDDAYELPPDTSVGVVHALELAADTAARWGQVFGDYEILQPFRQLGREHFAITEVERGVKALDRFKGVIVPTGKVLGLEARGWRRGAAQDAGCIWWFEKALPGMEYEARLSLDPGIFVGAVGENPEQKLGEVTIVPPGSWRDEGLPLARLDAIVFSELVRDLEGLRN